MADTFAERFIVDSAAPISATDEPLTLTVQLVSWRIDMPPCGRHLGAIAGGSTG